MAKRSRKKSVKRRSRTHVSHSPVRRRKRRGLSAGTGIMGKAVDTALSMAGGALYGGVTSLMNLGAFGMVGVGVAGSLGLSFINPKIASGYAGGFGASLASYFTKRLNMQKSALNDGGQYVNKDVFKALPIQDDEGHPLVIDESTGKAYCHNANGEYRELTPAEYEHTKHAVASHYGVEV